MSPDDPALGVPGVVNAVVIGRGGYGTVYSAEEPEFGRTVAVKVLHGRLDGDSVRRAFGRECQAMGSLSGHPHIVTVHRGGTTARDEPYIVMDLMTAGSLADRITRDGPLPWAEVLEIGVTVAGALETAHRAGILHLDLKPANLLVSRYGEPKLGDFGISRLSGVAETSVGQVRASVAYAAPERLLEGTATVASDMYGLGATLFALLNGQAAFPTRSGEDLLQAVGRIVQNPVPDLRPRGVPDAVATVVERLMAKSPGDRLASASDAAAALQAAQRATGCPVTRAVVEGAAPRPGESITWPAVRPGAVAPPPRPPVPGPTTPVPAGAAAAARPGDGWDGRPFQGAGPTLVGGSPIGPPQGRRPLLVAGAAAAVVVVLGVTGTVLILNRSSAGGPPVPPAQTSSNAPATTTVTSTTVPAGAPIEVADGVDHPATADAAAVLGGYYTAINDGRYDDAFAVFSPESDAFATGRAAFAQSQSSTSIERQRISAVRDRGPGNIEVDVTFRSRQTAALGFEGQTCTDWALAYEMTGPGPDWSVLRARIIDPPQEC